jgi:hypothetical protein
MEPAKQAKIMQEFQKQSAQMDMTVTTLICSLEMDYQAPCMSLPLSVTDRNDWGFHQ